MSENKVLLRHVTVGRDTGEKDVLGAPVVERVELRPGEDVPDWAKEQLDESYFGDPADGTPVEDGVLREFRRQASNEGVPWDETWSKEQVAAGIRANREAALNTRQVNWDEFVQSFENAELNAAPVAPSNAAPVAPSRATNDGGSTEDPASYDVESLRTEYKQLTGKDAKDTWRPSTLARNVEAERQKQAGSNDSGDGGGAQS
jgi:hypothetical protein